MKKIEDVLTKKEIKYMAGRRKGQRITIERHIINGKSTNIKKAYVSELSVIHADDLEAWFRKELRAKKILKYQKDKYSFNWIVWYI